MEYYFTKKKNVDTVNNELIVDDFEFRHLVKVLRKQEGDKIIITDGERNIYNCEIKSISRDKLYCNIISTDYNLFEPTLNLSLYLSPLRNASRFEFAVEKAVELGVKSIHTVITEHTVIKNSFGKAKSERIKKIIIGAMGQSQRCVLPEFHDSISFKELIEKTKDESDKIVMYEFSNDDHEFKLNPASKCLSVLIGPEGGFSQKEIVLLKQNNWQVRSLGKRKLRAETAAIISVHEILSK